MRTFTILSLCVLASLFTSANVAGAMVFRVEATAEASACCRPNGATFSSIELFFLVEVRDVDDGFLGSTVTYQWVGKPSCDFAGVDLTDSSVQSFTITSGAMVRTRNVNKAGPQCPFGLRGKSTAILSIVPGLSFSTVQDLSECPQPCYGCDGLPFEE